MRRALLLRAREDAARTAAKLREMGVAPVVSPVLDIVATGAEIPAGAYDALLASSAKGVECAGDLAALKRLPFHAVGAKTAEAARHYGLHPEIVAGNAAAILPLLLAHYPSPSHFLYLAGRDRQPTLEAGLRAAGHRIDAVDVYDARAAEALTVEAIDAMRKGEIGAILHYSRRSAEIFLTLAEKAEITDSLPSMLHAALSEDVATPLRAAGLKVSVAEKPDEAHLLAVLAEFYG